LTSQVLPLFGKSHNTEHMVVVVVAAAAAAARDEEMPPPWPDIEDLA